MKRRLNHAAVNPEAFQAMLAFEEFARSRGIDPKLYHLIKLRASLINGCAYCVDMHSKDMLKEGESFQRIALVSVWRESPCYSEAEKAALELTEYVTRLPEAGVPEDVYERVRAHYGEREYVDLIMAINAINSWNRLSVSTGLMPALQQ
ncbi:alkyl hydroperoxide reductase AhpD [Cohnella xylanilytica]|uniref:Carboxymuconolactone decarboxylase family protein n=1 Tax=Cohnella xylanilytica TaxID=557555 RepID=A0A841U4Y5_9BACL|nr:carboxymuconolactone decarboxylase family protein [Cohnella xylanilytica]MBB6695676.1 carboxymuconolactone decarboxylase family protein [Cohnella xylanilytica]GIO16256.1 alkyl hydroperoxide reductase AhpD [Cohnella xylanilytica]